MVVCVTKGNREKKEELGELSRLNYLMETSDGFPLDWRRCYLVVNRYNLLIDNLLMAIGHFYNALLAYFLVWLVFR